MRLAISNIAWDVADDAAVATILERHGVDAIDVAPGKYFPDPAAASARDIARVRSVWRGRGIEITGMQALLFGTSGLNMFGSVASRAAMLEHLADVCRIASGLGARRLVFGSPKNRDRSGLDDAATMRGATEFFRSLGELAGGYGVVICLEPNPPHYGANFMLDSAQTAAVVEAVDRPEIRMQLDTGAITLNAEDPYESVTRYAPLIGHVHASEPDLVTLGDGATDHARVAAALRASLPEHVVSIEMLPAKTEPNLVALERALSVARRFYAEPVASAERVAG